MHMFNGEWGTIDISDRLLTIANRVKYRTLADVGTDHAYLPVFLCKKGAIDFAVASDVNEGPLRRAKENIERWGLSGKIEARLGSGLSPIHAGEAETLVMAGMGGMLMTGLLSDTKSKSFKQLLLQPQRDAAEVRRFLINVGFVICDEEMLIDGGKFYTVLDCAVGQSEEYSEKELLFGKALTWKQDGVLKAYIETEVEKLERIFKAAGTTDSFVMSGGYEKKIQYLATCREVLACL